MLSVYYCFLLLKSFFFETLVLKTEQIDCRSLSSTVYRHTGYYVFINKVEADVKELTTLSPVYYESDSSPSTQNIIMFPGGISGKQLYIYKNTSGPSQNVNNILDICEVEIWGIYNVIFLV